MYIDVNICVHVYVICVCNIYKLYGWSYMYKEFRIGKHSEVSISIHKSDMLIPDNNNDVKNSHSKHLLSTVYQLLCC